MYQGYADNPFITGLNDVLLTSVCNFAYNFEFKLMVFCLEMVVCRESCLDDFFTSFIDGHFLSTICTYCFYLTVPVPWGSRTFLLIAVLCHHRQGTQCMLVVFDCECSLC